MAKAWVTIWKALTCLIESSRFGNVFPSEGDYGKELQKRVNMLTTHIYHYWLPVVIPIKRIIKFINSTNNYDKNFILRLCISHQKYHSAVLLYTEMKLFEQALDLALSHELVSLAEFILSKFDTNDDEQVSSIKYENANYNTKESFG